MHQEHFMRHTMRTPNNERKKPTTTAKYQHYTNIIRKICDRKKLCKFVINSYSDIQTKKKTKKPLSTIHSIRSYWSTSNSSLPLSLYNHSHKESQHFYGSQRFAFFFLSFGYCSQRENGFLILLPNICNNLHEIHSQM